MDLFRTPLGSGGTRRQFTERFGPWLLIALAGVLLAGGLGLSSFSGHAAPGGLSAPHPAGTHLAPAVHIVPLSHGDLVVSATNSPFLISPATTGSNVYQQGGNITVLAGGTLIVRSITLQFVQFIGATGDALQRSSHLYTFVDQGTVQLVNASLTTDVQILNAYPKLTLNISSGGQFALTNSTFDFPGWVSVYGSGSLLNATHSLITGDREVGNLTENITIQRDTLFAPSLAVSGGAHAFLGASAWASTYADNITASGRPGLNPVTSNQGQAINQTTGATWNIWTTWTDSENLSRDLLYPSVSTGWLQFNYSTSVSQTATGNSVGYGASYPLPAIEFNSAFVYLNVSLTPAVIAAINAGGIPSFLEATGAFGNTATLGVTLGTTGAVASVDISAVSFHLVTDLDYNMTVSGSGSILTAVDSSLDLNWNLTPGSVVPAGFYPPSSWGSNKLLVSDASAAYLANLTIPVSRGGVFWNQSAVLPDASSTVNFYRWSEVPVVAANSVPIAGAHLTAFYAYDNSQANNATATALNNLPVSDPELASYAATAGGGDYGTTGPFGNGQLLLASTVLSQSSLPDGVYLGGYHVAVALAGGGAGATKWGYASVAAYPSDMNPAGPDVAAAFDFPTYAPSLAVSDLTVNVDGAPVAAVTLGQTVNVTATVKDSGSGPVATFAVTLTYVQKSPLPAVVIAGPENFSALAAGNSQVVSFSWKTNESVLGDFGFYNGTFALDAAWNGGTGPNAGTTTYAFTIPLAPSQITLTIQPPGQPLKPGTAYVVLGEVMFNGSGQSTINLTAIAPNGDRYQIGAIQTEHGSFLIDIEVTSTMPSGTYAINASAAYDQRTVYVLAPAAFSIASTATTNSNFLTQTFLGLPVFLWIIIVAAICAAIGIFFFVVRRQARGKLVECGECGQLIPEDATVCPKCGAEFESDLVRCSRCGSTIPANSQVCPECAAQLIGKPEEGARDPERQGYNDFVERFRAEARKELGDNYGEGAFWDWWKRQPSYLAFSQWKLQQQQGSRSGMGAPPTSPPGRGGGGSGGAAAMDASLAPGATRRPAPAARAASPPPAARPAAAAAATPAPPTPSTSAAPAGAAGGGLKPCSNCGKEIPPDYLVCPFCGAVTQ
ncbi:MAG: zinc ribbon domain-containing protein [Thermoplasmata archaeon]|nr:zinc ribbon domain-containing protein [Thermoplasmata archaeon]